MTSLAAVALAEEALTTFVSLTDLPDLTDLTADLSTVALAEVEVLTEAVLTVFFAFSFAIDSHYN